MVRLCRIAAMPNEVTYLCDACGEEIVIPVIPPIPRYGIIGTGH